LTQQRPETLDPRSKYYSCASITGKPYTEVQQMNWDLRDAQDVYRQLCEMEATFSEQLCTQQTLASADK